MLWNNGLLFWKPFLIYKKIATYDMETQILPFCEQLSQGAGKSAVLNSLIGHPVLVGHLQSWSFHLFKKLMFIDEILARMMSHLMFLFMTLH